MPRTKAKMGYGMVLGIESATPATYVKVGEVRGFTRERSSTLVDATHTESPNRLEEQIVAMRSPGTLTFDLNWDIAATSTDGQTLLENAWTGNHGAPVNFRLQFPFPSGGKKQIAFSGIVQSLSDAMPMNDVLRRSVTIAIQGVSPLADIPAGAGNDLTATEAGPTS